MGYKSRSLIFQFHCKGHSNCSPSLASDIFLTPILSVIHHLKTPLLPLSLNLTYYKNDYFLLSLFYHIRYSEQISSQIPWGYTLVLALGSLVRTNKAREHARNVLSIRCYSETKIHLLNHAALDPFIQCYLSNKNVWRSQDFFHLP